MAAFTDMIPKPRLPPAARPSRGEVVAVLLGAGAIGFLLGVVRYPTWPDALEASQVLAGVVNYPRDNPVYIYSTRTWSVVNQVLALLLSAGFSEMTVALAVSGATGMLSLQALGLLVLALSRDVPLAILAPVFVKVTNAVSGGVTYPVALMGVEPTYGVVGMSYILLAAGSIGVGRLRWGALLLGFAPAVHLTIGVLAITVTAIVMAIDRPRGMANAGRWFLAGAAAAAFCALVHYLRVEVPAPDHPLTFFQHWDMHRQPFPLLSFDAMATYFSAALPAFWLWRFGDDMPEHERVLLRIIVVAAALGGALSTSYWLVPPDVPNVIAALMPSRLLNLSIVSCMATIVGLSGRYRDSVAIQANLAILIVALLILSTWARVEVDETARFVLPWAGMGVAGSILVVLAIFHREDDRVSTNRLRLLVWLRRAGAGAIAMALLGVIMLGWRDFSYTVPHLLPDRSNDPFFATVAGRPGLLLTGSDVHLMQLETRRPVVLDGNALDSVIYAPEIAPEVDRTLQRVYNTDLLSLQRSHQAGLRPDAAKLVWEKRTPAEWRRLAHDFAFTDIITYAGWKLQLPVVASNGDFVLFTIPRVTP